MLKQLDLGDFEGIETIQLLPGWSSIVLNSGIELDIMTSMKGFDQTTFDKSFEMSVIASIENVSIRFLS